MQLLDTMLPASGYAPTRHVSRRIQRARLLFIVHAANSDGLYSEVLQLEALTLYALLLHGIAVADNKVSDCRFKDEKCRYCGKKGHIIIV